MATVYTKPGESFDSLYRRFKKAVERSGVLSDLKKYEYYEKPSVRRKRKQIAARKREMKRQMKSDMGISGRNINFVFNKDKTVKLPPNKRQVPFKPNQQLNRSDNRDNRGVNTKAYNNTGKQPYTQNNYNANRNMNSNNNRSNSFNQPRKSNNNSKG